MAVTPETVSRPNSRSMAARSSRRSSKTSRPLVRVEVLTRTFSPQRHRVTEEAKANSFLFHFFRFMGSLWLCASVVNYSVASVVRELHVDSEILLTQKRDDFLQRVAVFAADADQVSLD